MEKKETGYTEIKGPLLQKIVFQEQLLKNFEKEIFENVSQVLSLAKIKLYELHLTDKKTMMDGISQSSNLIAKAIGDLRNLAQQVKAL